MDISVELVPRTYDTLKNDLGGIKRDFNQIQTVNIPDLVRYPIRSWEGSKVAQSYVKTAIPHIRARDFSTQTLDNLISIITQNEFTDVLIVSGDEHKDCNSNNYNSIELISELNMRFHNLNLWAAYDQYKEQKLELDNCQRKIDAGAKGFFTQPFFDAKGVEKCVVDLGEVPIYFGLSPVESEKSKKYWETVNGVKFPTEFKPTNDWNKKFGKESLAQVKESGKDVYLMPITVDAREYVSNLLN